MDYWYFAYGSNLWTEQMVARTGPLGTGDERPRLARLPNYRLAFNMQGENGECYANIESPGAGVLGVIYRCGEEALKRLDRYETGYERRMVEVIDWQEVVVKAFAYIARPERVVTHGRPSAVYLEKIVRGAREQGIPEEYIEAVEITARE